MDGDDVLDAIIGSLAAPAQTDRSGGPASGGGSGGSYRSPTGRHRHQCERCHTVWEHESAFFATRAGHTCPNPECGHCPEGSCWEKYFGGDAPAYHDPGQKTFRKADGVPMKKAEG